MNNNNNPAESGYPMNDLSNNGKAPIHDGPTFNISQDNDPSPSRSLDQPTQLVCLNTTVPQNIAAKSLGDKHAPTRNSLRHSRMIVMNRHGRVPRKYLPLIIRNYKLVKALKVFTIILGMFMSVLSAWFVLWTPTLTSAYYPYWSAIPVFLSGVMGCVFLGFCPRPYPGRKLGIHYHISKFASILTACISAMTAAMVLLMAILHLFYIYNAACVPHDKFNATCVCSTASNSTHSGGDDSDGTYHYQDLTCADLHVTMMPMLISSCSLNLLAVILETIYLYVHWTSARRYVYTKIPAKNDSNAPGNGR
ncbi:uncharacterized protein LOC143204300 [Rhynchophorus ferrugineus]|uniref:uncharacterized protein LOC143204300 n=1 Tax=Rhynchophorus ferrugineus TaxID=354439 RepID=UPI003FCE941F